MTQDDAAPAGQVLIDGRKLMGHILIQSLARDDERNSSKLMAIWVIGRKWAAAAVHKSSFVPCHYCDYIEAAFIHHGCQSTAPLLFFLFSLMEAAQHCQNFLKWYKYPRQTRGVSLHQ